MRRAPIAACLMIARPIAPEDGWCVGRGRTFYMRRLLDWGSRPPALVSVRSLDPEKDGGVAGPGGPDVTSAAKRLRVFVQDTRWDLGDMMGESVSWATRTRLAMNATMGRDQATVSKLLRRVGGGEA